MDKPASKSPAQHDVNYILGLELKNEDAEKVANCFYLYCKKITELEQENKKLRELVKDIIKIRPDGLVIELVRKELEKIGGE